jgi:hypothetical protein
VGDQTRQSLQQVHQNAHRASSFLVISLLVLGMSLAVAAEALEVIGSGQLPLLHDGRPHGTSGRPQLTFH